MSSDNEMPMTSKHPIEDNDSWNLHLARQEEMPPSNRRFLKHHEVTDVEREKEEEWGEKQEKAERKAEKKRHKNKKKRAKHLEELYADPGIKVHTTHGMVIDAGSSGSRLHLYEWEPRVLQSANDVQEAVSGRKLSFPGTESRWTERLRPGISTFFSVGNDEEVQQSIAEYLKPLIDFATTILHEKQGMFDQFPIYLRATAGMRVLETKDRARIMSAVRKLFHNDTFCPFYFEDEQARTISGEEEAIYDWLGVNFLASNGKILQDSAGSGTVVSPRETYGALDLGGASTQIGFYEPNEDIMANLFKLQIGQGKHWNVYTHSFLGFGINEATSRFEARLADGRSPEERLVQGVHNPCLPGGSKKDIRTNIHINENGMETWTSAENYANGFYQATLINKEEAGNFEQCKSLVHELLHMEQNAWCDYDHKGDCSFAGVYQPKLPRQSDHFGDFIAFSNYVDIWKFLDLPERASIQQLENATQYACSLSLNETLAYNDERTNKDEVEQYCFRSVYALNLLQGYGFRDEDHITAKSTINGHKVGWPIGAMLYEINTLPWVYENQEPADRIDIHNIDYSGRGFDTVTLEAILVILLAAFAGVLYVRRNSNTRAYEAVKDVESYQHNC